nr:hypothetical protein [Tanacetum cinerariifolium]
MHVPWVLCMRTVASIFATVIPQKSLIDHGLHSFWSHVVRVVRVGWWWSMSPSGSGHDLSILQRTENQNHLQPDAATRGDTHESPTLQLVPLMLYSKPQI